MKIVVIGTGYVGLVTGVCFAEMGHHVTCLDTDETKIDCLNQRQMPIYEPGLLELTVKNLDEKRVSFTTDYACIEQAQICFLALPTPSCDDGSCDLSYLENSIIQLASHLNQETLIVNKSTAPVGTVEFLYQTLDRQLKKLGKTIEFDVVSNPEFLKEGSAVEDCMKPDRIIIGTKSPKAKQIMQKIYSPFMLSRSRILFMDPRSAEMAKYASNGMLATRISFMNEIAALCEALGGDVDDVRRAVGSDRRIGPAFLYAGVGYGGSCFPKDVQALRALAKKNHLQTALLDATHLVNEQQKKKMGHLITSYFDHDVKGKTIGVWGLTYKPQTDDLRQSPAIVLIEDLLKQGAFLKVFDPAGQKKAKQKLVSDRIIFAENEYEAAMDVDALVLMTEWKQFRFVDLHQIKKMMKGTAFFDGRNQYSVQEMVEHGFDYFCIGKEVGLAKVSL